MTINQRPRRDQQGQDHLELLSAYLDSEVSAEEQSRVELRLHNDTTLVDEFEELQSTCAALRELAWVTPPRSFTLDASTVRLPKTRSLLWMRFGGVFATLLVAATFMTMFSMTDGTSNIASATPQTGNPNTFLSPVSEVALPPVAAEEEESVPMDEAGSTFRESGEIGAVAFPTASIASPERKPRDESESIPSQPLSPATGPIGQGAASGKTTAQPGRPGDLAVVPSPGTVAEAPDAQEPAATGHGPGQNAILGFTLLIVGLLMTIGGLGLLSWLFLGHPAR
ncbi:MAG: hypothetical protein HC837_04690 [Chloroflexaceae bacterium]|nr:hypothetical protein [Chloroflexaceae bacterium]